MLVSQLESDFVGSCNALLVPFITSFHIFITFSYGSPSCMMYIHISLFTISINFDNYTPRSRRGLGSNFYTMLSASLLLRFVLVNTSIFCPYDFSVYAYSTL